MPEKTQYEQEQELFDELLAAGRETYYEEQKDLPKDMRTPFYRRGERKHYERNV